MGVDLKSQVSHSVNSSKKIDVKSFKTSQKISNNSFQDPMGQTKFNDMAGEKLLGNQELSDDQSKNQDVEPD